MSNLHLVDTYPHCLITFLKNLHGLVTSKFMTSPVSSELEVSPTLMLLSASSLMK